MTPKEEAEFTKLATRVLEPACSGVSAYDFADRMELRVDGDTLIPDTTLWKMGMILDAESNFIALCPTIETAKCLAELINYACINRPFTNPEDPTIVRIGL